MVDIPKCKDGYARLKISIQPNKPQPGSYTVHFGGEGGAFNAAQIVTDLPQQYLHVESLAEERGFSICYESGDLYVESTGIDASADLTPSSHVVNLYQIFKDSESEPIQTDRAFAIPMDSIVPGESESRGIAFHKEEEYWKAHQIFDEAILNGEIMTAGGWYFAGLNALMLVQFNLLPMGEDKTTPHGSIGLSTFETTILLWGAAIALSRSEQLMLGRDDSLLSLVQTSKIHVLNRLDGLGQIEDPELKSLDDPASGKVKIWDPAVMHPEKIRRETVASKMRLERNPNDLLALKSLALFYSHVGRLDEAIKLAERGIALSDDEHEHFMHFKALVHFYRKAGGEHLERRIQALEGFLATFGHKRAVFDEWKELAELYRMASRFPKAIETAEEAVLRARLWVKRTRIRLTRSDPGQRKAEIDRYGEIVSELVDALNFLGSTYMASYNSNPQTKLAEDYLSNAAGAHKRALKIRPENYDGRLGLANADFKLGNHEGAVQAILEAIKLNDNNHDAVALLYEIHHFLDRHPEAAADSKNLRHLLAQALTFSGKKESDTARALQLFRNAASIDPRNIKARQLLGLTLYDTSAQDDDEPKYREEALRALHETLVLEEGAKMKKRQFKLTDDAYFEVAMAFATVASELKDWGAAAEYLNSDRAKRLEEMGLKPSLPPDAMEVGRRKHERELRAIDSLMASAPLDGQGIRRLKILEGILLGGLKNKAKTSGPESSNSGSTSGARSNTSSTPEPANSTPSTSGAPEQSAAPGWSPTVSVGGFAINRDDLSQSRTTSYTSGTSATIRYRRKRARSNGWDIGSMMQRFGTSTFRMGVPTGQTNTMGRIPVPVWFSPVGR